MADAGDALALKGRGGGEQRARWREDDALPSPLAHPAQKIAAENACRAAAAAAPTVHVLRIDIVEQQPAVGEALAEGNAVARKKIGDDVMPELAEIARHDEVVVLRHRLRVAEECAERIVGRRG